MKPILFLIGVATILCCTSCADGPVPKPKALLRLEYPEANYQKVKDTLPFSFEKNTSARALKLAKVDPANNSFGINIDYPALKATIYLTYFGVSDDNLIQLIRESQNLTQEHTVKADHIQSSIYEDARRKVYGMFYEIGGNAASQSQFYVTDSTRNFLTGALYFYAKPNYDSILPAARYLENDIKHLMETLEWN